MSKKIIYSFIDNRILRGGGGQEVGEVWERQKDEEGSWDEAMIQSVSMRRLDWVV